MIYLFPKFMKIYTHNFLSLAVQRQTDIQTKNKKTAVKTLPPPT